MSHECKDLDLAAWSTGFEQLNELRRVMSRGFEIVQYSPDGGVAHHQMDVHRFNAARFACEPKVLVFDRPTGFLVPLPEMPWLDRLLRRAEDPPR